MASKNGQTQSDAVSEITACLTPFRAYPVLNDRNEFNRLFRQFQHGKTEKDRLDARNRIIYGNVRLVVPIVKQCLGRGMSPSDMFQEGAQMLERVLDRFDPGFGAKFSTYASWWIRARITRALNEQSSRYPFRIPANARTHMNAIRRIMAYFYSEYNRWPTAEELVDLERQLDDSPKILRERLSRIKAVIMLILNRPESIDSGAVNHDGDEMRSLHERLVHDQPSGEVQLANEILKQRLAQALEKLPEREAFIMRHRFGIGDLLPMTLKEIGDMFHLSRERVRQLESRSLKALSKILGPDGSDLLLRDP